MISSTVKLAKWFLKAEIHVWKHEKTNSIHKAKLAHVHNL